MLKIVICAHSYMVMGWNHMKDLSLCVMELQLCGTNHWKREFLGCLSGHITFHTGQVTIQCAENILLGHNKCWLLGLKILYSIPKAEFNSLSFKH